MGARGPCPRRFPGAVVGKSRTTGSCYRTSVSSTIAKGSPGAGHHRHRLSSQALARGLVRERHTQPRCQAWRAAKKNRGKKCNFTCPARKSQARALQSSVVMLRSTLGRCHHPGPGARGGGGRILLVMATMGTRPGRDASTGWDTTLGWTPLQWHPWMGLTAIPPSPRQFRVVSTFPPQQHPSLPASPPLKPPPRPRRSSVPQPRRCSLRLLPYWHYT